MRLPARLALAVLALAPLVAGAASAAIEERPLRAGTGPLALAFDEDGMLWVTLDRAWAVGRYDTATGNLTEFPLTVDRRGATDELSGLHVGRDAVWTASGTHLHRVDRATGNVTSYALPTPTDIAGDVIEADGRVYVAGVTSDRVSVFNTADGNMTEIALPARSGPLGFAAHGTVPVVALTYSGGLVPIAADGSTPRTFDASLRGPVGIAFARNDLWVAEMGASTVALAPGGIGPGGMPILDGHVARYPTSPSPFYVISGPSDILVVGNGSEGGKVFFAEHFADRIGLLDLAAGTLVEWMAPSAPGTNLQRLALAPDGKVWTAEWSKDRLAVLDPVVAGAAFPKVPEETVHGALGLPSKGTLRVPVPGVTSAAAEPSTLKVSVEKDTVVLDASAAPDGAHRYRVLASTGDGRLLHGRYFEVVVGAVPRPADTSTPGVGGAAAAIGAAFAAFTLRRRVD